MSLRALLLLSLPLLLAAVRLQQQLGARASRVKGGHISNTAPTLEQVCLALSGLAPSVHESRLNCVEKPHLGIYIACPTDSGLASGGVLMLVCYYQKDAVGQQFCSRAEQAGKNLSEFRLQDDGYFKIPVDTFLRESYITGTLLPGFSSLKDGKLTKIDRPSGSTSEFMQLTYVEGEPQPRAQVSELSRWRTEHGIPEPKPWQRPAAPVGRAEQAELQSDESEEPMLDPSEVELQQRADHEDPDAVFTVYEDEDLGFYFSNHVEDNENDSWWPDGENDNYWPDDVNLVEPQTQPVSEEELIKEPQREPEELPKEPETLPLEDTVDRSSTLDEFEVKLQAEATSFKGPDGGAKQLRVLTYNIWLDHFEMATRMDAIGKIIKAYRPDVIALQEMTNEHWKYCRQHEAFRQYHWLDTSTRVGPKSDPSTHSRASLGYYIMLGSLEPFLTPPKRAVYSNTDMWRGMLATEIQLKQGFPPLVVGTTHMESTFDSNLWSYKEVRQQQLREGMKIIENIGKADLEGKARDEQCWRRFSSVEFRDATCAGDLVCARKGHDGRNFGCAKHHCCSEVSEFVLARWKMEEKLTEAGFSTNGPEGRARTQQCWRRFSSIKSRDASCAGDLVCARKGHDGRNFGCKDHHCCSEDEHKTPRWRIADMLIAGDTNMADGQLDDKEANEEIQLLPNWEDAWTSLKPNETGYTFDFHENSMLEHSNGWARQHKARLRYDRFFTRLKNYRVADMKVLGMDPFSGASDASPVWPSDHFGLLLKLEALD